jgi:cobalt-zinc-cadmium efflux system membrane fusion protein
MSARSHHLAAGCRSGLVIVLVSLGLATGCSDELEPESSRDTTAAAATTASAPAAITLSPDEMRAGGIAVDVPRRERRTSDFTASAVLHVDETRTARVGSIVEGIVVDTPASVGARVKRGALLASIHSHLVHEAWAEYRRALAERRRAASELAFAKEAEGRAARLFAAKAASRQEAERAQTERAAAEEALVIAESEITRALDELEHLGLRPETGEPDREALNDARETVPVTAAVGGVVLERLVTAGTAVTIGTPLFVVSDLSRLWAIAEIDERQLSSVAVGRTAGLTVAAYPDRVFQGRIVAIGDSINPDTRRVTVRIEVGNADGSLKPQMFATIRLADGKPHDVRTLPAEAVQTMDRQSVVFVEDSPGRFVQRHVAIGAERDGHVEVIDGLGASDRVAIAGAFLLKSKFLEAALPE